MGTIFLSFYFGGLLHPCLGLGPLIPLLRIFILVNVSTLMPMTWGSVVHLASRATGQEYDHT